MREVSKEYELTTIADIFDKVPSDRIRDCCRELGMILAQTKALTELMAATAESVGLPDASSHDTVGIAFPIVWTDDGKGELVTTVDAGNEEVLRMETKLAAAEIDKGMGVG